MEATNKENDHGVDMIELLSDYLNSEVCLADRARRQLEIAKQYATPSTALTEEEIAWLRANF